MRQMRQVHVVGLAVAAFGLLHVARADEGSTSVVFAPSHNSKVVRTIFTEIKNAKSTIDVAMFLFSDQDLADALIDAKKRGVSVQVITDRGMAKLGSSRDDYLAYNGIAVKKMGDGTASGAKFHHKFAVFDGRTVITGSMNWAENTEAWNYENTITIRDPEIALAYTKEFDSLFLTGKGNVGSTQDVLFSPTGSGQRLERRIATEVNLAKTEVVASIYLFTSWDVAEGFAKALDRGVKVSILCDRRQYAYGKQIINSLAQRGAKVKLVKLNGSGILAEKFHDKYAVIDGKTVVTGSFNWAPNQDKYGWDNLVILRDPSLAQDYIKDFAEVWASKAAN